MTESNYRTDRRDYIGEELNRKDLTSDPLDLFRTWLEDAKSQSIDDATAMTVATADRQGVPTARTILLKHFDTQGLCWYTDKRSPQGQNIAENPQAELLFFWRQMFRQVRISGRIESVSAKESNAYFAERPLGSQISAAASEQSSIVANRQTLEDRVTALEAQHAESPVARPDAWGGYRLIATRFEFWQGRASRLHDRFSYQLIDGIWHIDRLAP